MPREQRVGESALDTEAERTDGSEEPEEGRNLRVGCGSTVAPTTAPGLCFSKGLCGERASLPVSLFRGDIVAGT